MFQSETFARAIHADRVRDLERRRTRPPVMLAADEPAIGIA